MTQKTNLTTGYPPMASLGKCMTLGGGIALLLITIFLAGAGEPNPAWPRFWMIRPLLIVPLAGTTGGLFYYLMGRFRYEGGWKKVLVNVLCLIVYVFGLWIGTVLGLDGTMWD